MEIDNVRTIQEREEMVRKQIISRNIKDERVTQALLKILDTFLFQNFIGNMLTMIPP